jgi:UDP-N-acetylmuramate: L-alanyl-gamma-D-glutamyl-meso-diaminopimelate ligase
MHIHILGIAGTFMASLALLAKELGFIITGQDQNIYPPMSDQLRAADITVTNGYSISDLPPANLIVIGNVMSRGMPIIEHILDNNLIFMSGPEFLAKFILSKQYVLAVTGTHGKTTTTSMLAWILHYAGLNPGFLIGGVAKNFKSSARIGAGNFFVIEGDEYDSAFFDKRSKFIHYRPKTLIINNIEFDHADIFPNISAIILQFHHLLRLIPKSGLVVFNSNDNNIKELFKKGCWSNVKGFSLEQELIDEQAALLKQLANKLQLSGEHNLSNALAASLAAMHVGVSREVIIEAIANFTGVVRRMDYKGCYRGVKIYDDFAHHPTAIKATIAAVNKKNPIVAIVDIGSNTMKSGINNDDLVNAVQEVDQLYFHVDPNKISWDIQKLFNTIKKPGKICTNISDLISSLANSLRDGDQVLFMSNGSLATASEQLIRKMGEN